MCMMHTIKGVKILIALGVIMIINHMQTGRKISQKGWIMNRSEVNLDDLLNAIETNRQIIKEVLDFLNKMSENNQKLIDALSIKWEK